MSVCCVRGCPSRYVNGGRNETKFHNLPQGLRNEQRRQMWEHNIGKKLTTKSVVCEKHFTPDQYEQKRVDGKKPLKWNAIPTIFPFKKIKREPSQQQQQQQQAANTDTSTNKYKIHILNNRNIISAISVPTIQLVPNYSIPIESMKAEAPRGFVPIAPKIQPKLQNAVALIPIHTKQENSEISKEIQRYQEELKVAKNKLASADERVKSLEKQMLKIDETLKQVFNADQLKYMGSKDKSRVFWSDETLDKASEIYLICGVDGYEVLLSHCLPYPPLEVLQAMKPELFMP